MTKMKMKKDKLKWRRIQMKMMTMIIIVNKFTILIPRMKVYQTRKESYSHARLNHVKDHIIIITVFEAI